MTIGNNTATGLGTGPIDDRARFVVRGGAGAIGDLLALDLTQTDTDTTNNLPGVTGSGLRNARRVADDDVNWGLTVICRNTTPDDGEAYCQMRGEADLKVSGSVAVGDPLEAVSGSTSARTAQTEGAKIIGIALEAGTNTTIRALFNGVEGLGTFTA